MRFRSRLRACGLLFGLSRCLGETLNKSFLPEPFDCGQERLVEACCPEDQGPGQRLLRACLGARPERSGMSQRFFGWHCALAQFGVAVR